MVFEDHHHRMLLYRYLINCGIKGREIRIEHSPAGRGSAESWVQKTFVKQVSAYRNRQARARTALIVIIDADSHTVEERLAQLDRALKEECKSAIAESELIARLVPKRNIETWILCLNEHTVDEQTDYKHEHRDWSGLIPPAANRLYEWTRLNAELPERCIDSLRTAVAELKRLTF
ncbi:MAG: hypothetical protein WCC87_21905 [Candidatus Korobacteraceae bacterium]